MDNTFNIGDLLEVTRKDGRQFKCIVVESHDGGFAGKVLSKDDGVGTSKWERYSNENDNRFQILEDCKEVKVLSRATQYKASGTLTLNESLSKSQMTYYETDLGDGTISTLCMCEGYGGWSFRSKEDRSDALKESYFNSQISKFSSREVLA